MRQLPIHFDATAAEQRIAASRRSIRWQIISLSITVTLFVISLVVWLVWPQWVAERLWVRSMQWVLGISSVAGLLNLLVRLVWLRQLRRARREIGEGLALVLSHEGIETADRGWRWEELASVRATPGQVGHGYRLDIRGADGQQAVLPLEALTLMPGSLDSAARAYSAGRHGVDLSALDD